MFRALALCQRETADEGLSDKGPMLETLDYTVLSILAVHQPFYISICISILPTQHTTCTFISLTASWDVEVVWAKLSW